MIARRTVRLASLLPVTALLLTGACGDESTPPERPIPPNPIAYPLAIGNRWTYSVQVVTGQAEDTLSRIDEVVGVEQRRGEDYHALRGTPSDGSPAAMTYLRQADQMMYIYPDISFDQSPQGRWLQRQVDQSLPWKLADFTGSTGKLFEYGWVDTTFVENNFEYQLLLSIVTANVGRTDLTVPEGTYSDVYQGRMTLLALFRVGGVDVDRISHTADIYIKDGVGLLKEVDEDHYPTEVGEIVSIQTSLLRSKHLVP